MTHQSPPNLPPYNYNDPRILYNENCFAYNGGYDLICLFGSITPERRRHVAGGRSGAQTVSYSGKKSHPQPEMVQLLFKTCLEWVNDKYVEDNCETRRYQVDKANNILLKVGSLEVFNNTHSSPLTEARKYKSGAVISELIELTTARASILQVSCRNLSVIRPKKITVTGRLLERPTIKIICFLSKTQGK